MADITIAWPVLIGVLIAAYLLGSVPFGVVIARAFGLGDLRQIGSGNIGATNVLRTGNKPAALLTLVLDAGKGAIAVLAVRAVFDDEGAAQLAGLAAFIGHIYPVFLRFKGGKGVATLLGTVLALNFMLGLIACALWLVGAFGSRISSVGALTAAAGAPIAALVMGRHDLAALTAILAVVVYYRHAANIARIKAGTEPKIGQGKTKA